MDTYFVKRYGNVARLGRHIRHDPASKRYAYAAGNYVSKRHESNVPTFDQGNLGSCTGNAATKCLSYAPFWDLDVQKVLGNDPDADETYAVGVYSDATKLDDYDGDYPPDDTGSDGLSVAKVLTNRKLISGYQHAFSLDALLTALSQQPVIVGTDWHEDMFNPLANGQLKITGSIAGGHEYVLDEIDVENSRVWMQNSWGDSWGQVGGRAWFTFADFGKLLAAGGDCTIFTPISQPAPTPTPTPDDPTADFKAAAETWLKVKHRTKNNVDFEKAVKSYLGL